MEQGGNFQVDAGFIVQPAFQPDTVVIGLVIKTALALGSRFYVADK